MVIKKTRLQNIVLRLLNVLKKEGVDSLPALERMLGKRFYIEDNTSFLNGNCGYEFIDFHSRPSNKNTRTHTISYAIERTGIPLEIKLNPVLGYSRIIIKVNIPVPGYESFANDYSGNIIQVKSLDIADWNRTVSEVRELARC